MGTRLVRFVGKEARHSRRSVNAIARGAALVALAGCGQIVHSTSADGDAGFADSDGGRPSPVGARGDAGLAGRRDGSSGDARGSDGPASRALDDGAARDGASPAGTLLHVGAAHVILGITDDGYVVYETATGIYALSIAPGHEPVLLYAFPQAETLVDAAWLAELDGAYLGGTQVQVIHDLVFVWTGITPNAADAGISNGGTPVGALSVWTSAMAAPRRLDSASIVSNIWDVDSVTVAASADSTFFLYTGAANATGTVASLFGASVDTGSPTTLAPYMNTTLTLSQYCPFELAFSGSMALAQYCPTASDDASPTALPVYAYLPGTWARTPVSADAPLFSPDATGSYVATTNDAGGIQLLPIDGGSPVSIDPSAPVSGGYFFGPGDEFIVYATDAFELQESPVPSSAPVTLQSNVFEITSVSPDARWVMFTPYGTTNGTLSLASTQSAAPATVLTSGGDTVALDGGVGYGGAAFAWGFTPDDSYAVFLDGVAYGPFVGGQPETPSAVTLKAASVTTGQVSTISPSTSGVNSVYFLGGARIAYGDHFNIRAGTSGTADLRIADLTGATASRVVAARADATFVVSSDDKQLVYSTHTGPNANGLYVVDVSQ